MFDMKGVQRIAEDMGAAELADFIESADADDYFDMAEQSASELRQGP